MSQMEATGRSDDTHTALYSTVGSSRRLERMELDQPTRFERATAYGVRRSAFGVRRLAFGFRCSEQSVLLYGMRFN